MVDNKSFSFKCRVFMGTKEVKRNDMKLMKISKWSKVKTIRGKMYSQMYALIHLSEFSFDCANKTNKVNEKKGIECRRYYCLSRRYKNRKIPDDHTKL